MSKPKFKHWLSTASLTLAGLFGAVSAAQAAVVVSFDPAYGSAIPNLGFKGTATLDVTPGCYTLGGGYFFLSDPGPQAAGCNIVVQSAHIDFYNTALGSNSVFSSVDLTSPFPESKLMVTQAYFDLETNELAGIATTDSSIFSVDLQDPQPASGDSISFAGLMVLYFETGFFGGEGAKGALTSHSMTATAGVGGARLSTCSPQGLTSDMCSYVTTSNLATPTFTNLGTVPEPGSLALAGVALAGLVLVRRRVAC